MVSTLQALSSPPTSMSPYMFNFPLVSPRLTARATLPSGS
jgi:hypothetical protein